MGLNGRSGFRGVGINHVVRDGQSGALSARAGAARPAQSVKSIRTQFRSLTADIAIKT